MGIISNCTKYQKESGLKASKSRNYSKKGSENLTFFEIHKIPLQNPTKNKKDRLDDFETASFLYGYVSCLFHLLRKIKLVLGPLAYHK